MWLSIFITSIFVILVYFLGYFTGEHFVLPFYVNKHWNEKHMCNHCKYGFISSKEKLEYIYCPYCGRALDYHEYDERSESYAGEE